MGARRSTKRIILTGFMGTGKSTVGRLMADQLGWAFIDTDESIEAEDGRSITEIFSQDGEPAFRELEKKILTQVLATKQAVIATGGGAIIDEENLNRMKGAGLLVALTATPEVILDRIRRQDTVRPLLQVPDPLAEIRRLLESRQLFYDKADNVIDTSEKSCSEISDEIIRILG